MMDLRLLTAQAACFPIANPPRPPATHAQPLKPSAISLMVEQHEAIRVKSSRCAASDADGHESVEDRSVRRLRGGV